MPHQVKALTIIATVALITSAAIAKQPQDGDKVTKPSLSKERIAYAIEYDALKRGLFGKTSDEMEEMEVLQAVAVQFSRAFKKTETRISELERRVNELEASVAALQKFAEDTAKEVDAHSQRIANTEKSIQAQEADLSNVFEWSKSVEKEIGINGVGLEPVLSSGGGIKGRLSSLEAKSVHNAGSISSLASEISNLRQVVNNILNALR